MGTFHQLGGRLDRHVSVDFEAGSRKSVIPRVDVLGVEVSAINPHMALSAVTEWIESDDRQYVCVTGVHGVMESQGDPDLKRIHNASGLTTPDGMPLVWCGRFAGAGWMERVYGPDLMLQVCAKSVDMGWKHFFYGAGPGVADELARRLSETFPGLSVAGTYSPPFRPLTAMEVDTMVDVLNESAADIVWIGLSTPKQERWMDQFRPLLDAGVLIGVGAAFDIHAGRLAQAPKWMQRSGLEWMFRLTQEPKRLWRRYLSASPRFLMGMLARRPYLVVDSADSVNHS
jgi:N-acetylglucosaminyldiphosphoundecaprenol N-acetyl-beta-D-mannosaminyltransferase